MWQDIVVFAIIALAAGFMAWRIYAKLTGKSSSCCGGDGGCAGSCQSSGCGGAGHPAKPFTRSGCGCSR